MGEQVPPSQQSIDEIVDLTLREDLGSGDLTASLLPEGLCASAEVISRDHAVLCGAQWLETVFHRLDPQIQIDWFAKDGDSVRPDQVLCRLRGLIRPLLTGERAALNFLQALSGTATVTRQYAERLANTQTRLLDTRKTLPGLREAQKYAVRSGGGHNHRMGLFDGILIKENHIATAGSILAAVGEAKTRYPKVEVEVEVEDLDELEEAVQAGADIIMLDNFSLGMMKKAVEFTAGRTRLEASGNFTLENIRNAADTGVNYISVGALTKHVRAVDLSMRILGQPSREL